MNEPSGLAVMMPSKKEILFLVMQGGGMFGFIANMNLKEIEKTKI